MTIKTIANGLQTMLEALVDDDSKVYFDHVWIGMPEKIPQGDKNIAIIQAGEVGNYQYTTCPEVFESDIIFYVDVMCKGKTETATPRCYDLVDLVVKSLRKDPKLNEACMWAEVSAVMFGDVIGDDRNLIAGGRITITARMG